MSTARAISSPRLVTSRPAPRRRAPKAPPGVVDQVRAALHPKARLATLMGALLGGFVPVATYVVAHYEVPAARGISQTAVALLLVCGGLLFSATTVYCWGRLAFRSGGKALGFVVLLEGVMIVSREPWLALSALVYLVAINAVGTGCVLSRRGDA